MVSSYYLILRIMIIVLAFSVKVMAGQHVLHPPISVLDQSGIQSCSPCHDTGYINDNNIHYNNKIKADCFVCHVKGSIITNPVNIHLKIQLPSSDNCAFCHGLTNDCRDALRAPADYMTNHVYKPGSKNYSITQNTGEVLAPSNISDSQFNIQNKNNLNYPWDAHARRQLNCISCHFTRNDPRVTSNIGSGLDHLTRDPRKIKPPNEYLKWPDHTLKAATCVSCHNPYAVHNKLPFRERHMRLVACQSCHVPKLYGPAFQVIDATVVNTEGNPRIEIRGEQGTNPGQSVNTQFMTGYSPFLFSEKTKTGRIIYPYNIKTEYYWIDKTTGKKIPGHVLSMVFLDGNEYKQDLIHLLDSNKNKIIDAHELVLDTREKIAYVQKQLRSAGIGDPVIKAEARLFKINHGVLSMKKMQRNCYLCHGSNSNFKTDVMIAARAPYGIFPDVLSGQVDINGGIKQAGAGIMLERSSRLKSFYVLGHGRHGFLRNLGFIFFVLALTVVFLHAFLRLYYSHHMRHGKPATERVYMYAGYERFWHWTMALTIILLIITGIEIHYAGSVKIFGLENTVAIHNVLATIMVINAGLSLFYHITTGEIKQFFSIKKGFFRETIAQASFYVNGIFKGEPHPVPKSAERKLNPLQQFTYVMILNILLPLQVLTGLGMWGINTIPELSQAIGGMTYIGPIHNFGSWLILTFLVVHVYLTTTGHTPLASIRAMITGVETIVKEDSVPQSPGDTENV